MVLHNKLYRASSKKSLFHSRPVLNIVIDNNAHLDKVITPPSARSRLYSLFKSTPVTIKESLHQIIRPSPTTIVECDEKTEDIYSEDESSCGSSLLSSDLDHMPVSPSDEIMPAIQSTDQPTQSSLACQIQSILGSTIEEVDKEIEEHWETSRNSLRKSIISTINHQYITISI
ncbi:hypothetical protein BDB01DRAFT_771797 [Pilobolus umbonatus]|nr:hypothetical protein BDB01DRAFT_771797 [Pilobolus umbonatus]